MDNLVNTVEESQRKLRESIEKQLLDDVLAQIERRKDKEIVLFNIPSKVDGKDVGAHERKKTLDKIVEMFGAKASFVYIQYEQCKLDKYIPKFDFLKKFRSVYRYTTIVDYNTDKPESSDLKGYFGLKFNSCHYRKFVMQGGELEPEYVESLLN
jgi:hypothetical protein